MPLGLRELLGADARRELLENILPFWRTNSPDPDHGGFVAEMSNDLRVNHAASKGLILNARILWTFSAVSRLTKASQDHAMARRAFEYLMRHFHDSECGGFFWELTPSGRPLISLKKVYGQAFCIYALAEYHRAFGSRHALSAAISLFHLLEKHARDPVHGGYWEALSRGWEPCADMRLSEKDLNEKKSMNNHLHILEAFASLLRYWPDPLLRQRLGEVLALFLERILDSSGAHFHHFFDEAWHPRSDSYTYGHDIEGSWLLTGAAEVLAGQGDAVKRCALRISGSVLREGLDRDGGLFYEGRNGKPLGGHKEWWPQAEAVVGFLNAWQLSGDEAFLRAAASTWQFIQHRIVDRARGEWFWAVSREGVPDDFLPKVSMWKCPYHNSRACLEIIRRTEPPSIPDAL